MAAAGDELDTRPDHEVFDGAGDDYLTRLRLGRHPGANVHGDTGDVIVNEFALTGVHTDPELQIQRGHGIPDGPGALNCPAGSMEDCQETISSRVHLMTFETGQLSADDGVMLREQSTP